MIKVLVTTVCVLAAALCCGQYTYFNNYYLPTGYNQDIGNLCSNITIKDSLLVTHGLIATSNSDYHRYHYFIDLDGNVVSELDIQLDSNDFYYLQYGDNLMLDDMNYYSGTGYANDSLQNTIPLFYYYNSEFELEWSRMFNQFQADTIVSAEFHTSVKLSDNTFIAAGPLAIDYNEFEPGDDNVFLLVSKFDEDSVYWTRQYPIYLNPYFPAEAFSIRISTITPLANGDFLLWGAWTGPWDPMVMRFNSEGEYLAEKHWGNPELDDWCAWPVKLNDSLFMFSNRYAVEPIAKGEPVTFDKPMVGLFNANTMDTVWTKTYDHSFTHTDLMDFEQTPDGGFVALGMCYIIEGPELKAFMLKVDSFGNEEWYQQYSVPVEPYSSTAAYDLEITPDGGLAFVGRFRMGKNLDIKPTWLVKTDACGDVVFNGCPTAVAEWTMGNAQWTIAPNPANHFVNISSDVEFESITIRDITGKSVYTSAMNNHVLQTQVDVSMLAKGIYLLEVYFGNGVIGAQKLVVE
jgi:hypothetical protein